MMTILVALVLAACSALPLIIIVCGLIGSAGRCVAAPVVYIHDRVDTHNKHKVAHRTTLAREATMPGLDNHYQAQADLMNNPRLEFQTTHTQRSLIDRGILAYSEPLEKWVVNA